MAKIVIIIFGLFLKMVLGRNSPVNSTIIKVEEQRLVENLRKKDTVDYQCDIITHQHGGYEIAGMLIEHTEHPLGETALLTIHLCQHPVTRDKGDFHT